MAGAGAPEAVRFGLLAWPQATAWEPYREVVLAAEAAGWDSIWAWDHLMAIIGSADQPIFEGWTSLAAFAALTSRVRLGLMVGANTFRNPGLTAKLATTLDHISEGRADLGIGGAWFEREHDAFGIEFGATVGARLDWLDESVSVIRRLLDGEVVTHDGPHYHLHDAICEPRPVQARLPILIGGSGPKKTLRTVARYGDAWNTSGHLDEVRERVRILEEHCGAVGRNPATIERTVSFPLVIRDDAEEAKRIWQSLIEHNGAADAGNVPHLLGSPREIAEGIRPFIDELGFSTVIARLPAPFDRETIDRIGEVRAALASSTAPSAA
jgi:F420-dependent oxidoreductase-like protein